MTRVLAVDTSTGTSVALVEELDGVISTLAEVNHPGAMRHAETIGLALAEVVAAGDARCVGSAECAGATGATHGVKHARHGQIDAVAVGRGPGPFTGLRVGMAAALVFAQARGIPAYGVVSLDAIALSEFANGDSPEPSEGEQSLLVTSDARRRELYWAVYRGLDACGAPNRSHGPGVLAPAALEALVAQTIHPAPRAAVAPVSAAALARVLLAQLRLGAASHDISALYLREPDAKPPTGAKIAPSGVA